MTNTAASIRAAVLNLFGEGSYEARFCGWAVGRNPGPARPASDGGYLAIGEPMVKHKCCKAA